MSKTQGRCESKGKRRNNDTTGKGSRQQPQEMTICTGNGSDIIQGNTQGNSPDVGNFLGAELVLGTWLVNGRW